ncbi:MAG: ATP-binding protein [Desulfobacterales bacterium]|nr:ATP-binding protein [Desulfobacterales bacterium]
MNTYTKILLTTLPLVFFFLIVTVGTTYYFSRSALLDLGETWLDTRLQMAADVVKAQENILHEYDLHEIPASIIKAKFDAIAQIRNIQVGKQGYIFAVDRDGVIVFHPNKYLVETDINREEWFMEMKNQQGRLILNIGGEDSLARFQYFAPWGWYIVAVDPMKEVYGVSNRMKPYLISLGIIAAVIISLALMVLTKRLTRPLKDLVRGAEDIGKGNLETRISLHAKDEFGHLAKEFNQMAFRLQETLTALQYSEEHFRALIENASDLIWILDKLGNFIYVSPSTRRILGYDSRDLLGKNAFDFVHPDDRQELYKRFQKRSKSLIKAQPTAHRFRHKQEYWCILESIGKNLLNHPAISGMVINSRNITKRKRTEQALKQSHQRLEHRVQERTRELTVLNKTLNNEIQIRKQKEDELARANLAKSNFLANVSHEIRTPLNSVMGFSELLTTMIKDRQQASYLSAISLAGKNLLALINDILDLSKMEAGKLEISNAPVSPATLFKEVFHLFDIKAREKGLHFSTHIPPDLPGCLFLDEMHLRQVLTNLIDNAIKFTKNGSIKLRITVNLSACGSHTDLEISVKDTGIGIPEDKQDIVFESFQQASAGTSRKFGGTGLGLAICKQLTSLMGGRITVKSSPGRGSLFTLYLSGVKICADHRPGKPEPPEEEMTLDKIRFTRKCVLVADDHEPFRFMLREILEKTNLKVIEAENGEQAVATARTHLPSLIFMDVKMPVLNGREATARLKSDPVTRDIPVCLTTASMQQPLTEDLSNNEFTCSLTKPIIISELIQVLVNHLPASPPEGKNTRIPEPLLALDHLELNTLSTGLQERLAQEIIPCFPELRDAMRISDIRSFAERIRDLGSEFESNVIQDVGQALLGQAETFDIEKITLSLEYFSDSLRKKISQAN